MAKWILSHGAHNGTITSRESATPEEFDTPEEALTNLELHRTFYTSIGYKIWYAYLTNPDGEQIKLESNNQYY